MTVVVAFASADAASRRVAGVAAAARIARARVDRGETDVALAIPRRALTAAARADLDRLAPGTRLIDADDVAGPVVAAPELEAAAILRATGKAGDGPVSRWLNRPVSRTISSLLLMLPGIRPIHATIGTALIAVAMFAALATGSVAGLVVGALLYHAASVFDGVDGEIARATWRTSPAGATIDTVVDIATNLLFLVGLVANLAMRGVPYALPIGLWSLALLLLGLALQSWRALRGGGTLTLDRMKRDYPALSWGKAQALLIRLSVIISSRDTFAFLFALLTLLGMAMLALWIFAVGATIWILFVLHSVLIWSAPPESTRSA